MFTVYYTTHQRTKVQTNIDRLYIYLSILIKKPSRQLIYKAKFFPAEEKMFSLIVFFQRIIISADWNIERNTDMLPRFSWILLQH